MTEGDLLSIRRDIHFSFSFFKFFLVIYARANFPEKDNKYMKVL
jgi:hypothetical protein